MEIVCLNHSKHSLYEGIQGSLAGRLVGQCQKVYKASYFTVFDTLQWNFVFVTSIKCRCLPSYFFHFGLVHSRVFAPGHFSVYEKVYLITFSDRFNLVLMRFQDKTLTTVFFMWYDTRPAELHAPEIYLCMEWGALVCLWFVFKTKLRQLCIFIFLLWLDSQFAELHALNICVGLESGI